MELSSNISGWHLQDILKNLVRFSKQRLVCLVQRTCHACPYALLNNQPFLFKLRDACICQYHTADSCIVEKDCDQDQACLTATQSISKYFRLHFFTGRINQSVTQFNALYTPHLHIKHLVHTKYGRRLKFMFTNSMSR